jgi:hypothetical protein
MSGGLRFRNEEQLFSSKGTPLVAGTQTIVPAAALVGVQRACIYRYRIQAVAASTYQFQDTGGNLLSTVYSLTLGQIDIERMAINGDYLWQSSAPGLGIQLIVGGTGPINCDIWWAPGA